MQVRIERVEDHDAVRALNREAFGRLAEADLVDAVRAGTGELISLVALHGGDLVGHILFSPVTLAGHTGLRMMGLGPMAVAPAHQHTGVGSALVRRGLELCRDHGYAVVVVLGHVRYYPKFGFTPAARYGITCEFDVPDGAFQIIELVSGALRGVSGIVRYDDAFDTV